MMRQKKGVIGSQGVAFAENLPGHKAHIARKDLFLLYFSRHTPTKTYSTRPTRHTITSRNGLRYVVRRPL
jgi:hypothetical protein